MRSYDNSDNSVCYDNLCVCVCPLFAFKAWTSKARAPARLTVFDVICLNKNNLGTDLFAQSNPATVIPVHTRASLICPRRETKLLRLHQQTHWLQPSQTH